MCSRRQSLHVEVGEHRTKVLASVGGSSLDRSDFNVNTLGGEPLL